jgi:pimeloyl-ACP methyl ester carboxylesterase
MSIPAAVSRALSKALARAAAVALSVLALGAAPAAPAAANAANAAGAAWIEHAVTLSTPDGTLYGTELLPQSEAPPPMVLLHAGSGPTNRDGNSAGLPGPNDSLKLLAEGLARQGVATLRFDKRGVGQSAAAAPAEAQLRFETYVQDAGAWLARLRAERRYARLIVAGHSEGALIGMLAARRADADAFVSIAGPARAADEVIAEQLKPALPAGLYQDSLRIMAELKAGRSGLEVPPALAALFRPSVQPYLVSWFKYTPAVELAKLGVPVLIVQGDADLQVASAEARALGAAKPDAGVLVVEGMNHVLKLVGSDAALQRSSYSRSDLAVSAQLVQAIAAFAKDPAKR